MAYTFTTSDSGVLIADIEPSSAMVHFITATTGDIFVRLTTAPAGTVKIIKRMDASAHGFYITGDVGGTALVEGLNDIGMGAQYSFRTLICDGSNWWIIGSNGT